jgi:hypothetical protein
MYTRGSSDRAERREVPPALIVAVIALLVLGLGAGGYYAFNSGWKTDAQKDDMAKHEVVPILAAKHGDMEPLAAENKLRQRQGQAPLAMPDDKKQTSPNDPAKLADLQRRMGAKQDSQPNP